MRKLALALSIGLAAPAMLFAQNKQESKMPEGIYEYHQEKLGSNGKIIPPDNADARDTMPVNILFRNKEFLYTYKFKPKGSSEYSGSGRWEGTYKVESGNVVMDFKDGRKMKGEVSSLAKLLQPELQPGATQAPKDENAPQRPPFKDDSPTVVLFNGTMYFGPPANGRHGGE